MGDSSEAAGPLTVVGPQCVPTRSLNRWTVMISTYIYIHIFIHMLTCTCIHMYTTCVSPIHGNSFAFMCQLPIRIIFGSIWQGRCKFTGGILVCTETKSQVWRDCYFKAHGRCLCWICQFEAGLVHNRNLQTMAGQQLIYENLCAVCVQVNSGLNHVRHCAAWKSCIISGLNHSKHILLFCFFLSMDIEDERQGWTSAGRQALLKEVEGHLDALDPGTLLFMWRAQTLWGNTLGAMGMEQRVMSHE